MTERRRVDPLPLGGQGGLPYSKGLMARALMATGLTVERAYELARLAETDLAARGSTVLDLDRLDEPAVETLGSQVGGTVVRQLRRLQNLHELDVPVILLVGGATGTGKSTVATESAHLLGITRVTSTDFVRQTMRAFFAKEFMPSIHYSSFEARLALPVEEQERTSEPVLLAFVEQTRNVLVGVKAAVDRALQEGWSMVLEGVHLVPGMLPETFDGRALVVQCVLAIDDEEAHADHFSIRGTSSHGLRPVEKYLDWLPEIRVIQDYLVARARREAVPVIHNRNIDAAISDVIELVLANAEQLQKVQTA